MKKFIIAMLLMTAGFSLHAKELEIIPMKVTILTDVIIGTSHQEVKLKVGEDWKNIKKGEIVTVYTN